jgi:hypothetical protein
MTLPAVILIAAGLALAPLSVLAQAGPRGRPDAPAPTPRPERAPSPHGSEELDCRNCHRGEHRGVVQMYIGIGGRGTPTIPSHMFQVRVECVACHTTPKAREGTGELSGQTFKPSEQACLACHGEKYRGMLKQWTATLARMTDVVAPKLRAARAALQAAARSEPKADRARVLVDDAEFNVRYVALAKGVHNVFYAADLLKLANGWLDEAGTLLGKPVVRSDDQLVRGGYCAVLCHQAAGVKPKETVTFGRQKVPHARHVNEFGATCTSCHSAEAHKAVTATAATCSSCHHSPQNDRCESCHARQAAFYRGQTKTPLAKVEPNLMAAAVPCTGCHDFGAKSWRAALGDRCVGCHEAPYTALLPEWTIGFAADVRKTSEALGAAEAAVARARRSGRKTPEADGLLKEARDALAVVRNGRPAHNPLAADALLASARRKAADARARIDR